MHKLTRISWNSEGWKRPTGDARKYEMPDTYNHIYGFGHEDWFFRDEWEIDGWRYAFLQGVNKSHAGLVASKQSLDVTLFCIDSEKRRRPVATIRALECLDEPHAVDALEEFKRRGWYDTMRAEIRAAGGDDSALGATEWAQYVLNVRFRRGNVARYPAQALFVQDSRIKNFNRYQLYDFDESGITTSELMTAIRTGSPDTPEMECFWRKGTAPTECTPEHARMQAKLMEELRAEYPGADIRREVDFIDVRVQTADELVFFEIKSDLEPRSVIRQALGQILEYAFHPSHSSGVSPQLVIVGRAPLSVADQAYMDRLRTEFSLPIRYRVVGT